MIDAIGFVPHARAAEMLEMFTGGRTGGEPRISKEDDGLQEYVSWWESQLQKKFDASSSTEAATSTRLRVRYAPAVQRPVDSQRVERISTMNGNADQGQELFHSKQGTCGNCHRLRERGGDVGPNLTQISARLTRRQLVEAILYPSNSVLTGYESWSIIDKQGRVSSGLLEGVAEHVTLKNADAKRITIATTEIEELVRQGASIMPEDLSKSLSDQQIADLVTFLAGMAP